jgi:hypothetical protein
VGAVCGKAARTDLCGGRAMKRTSLPLQRREFIAVLGGATWSLVARAQQAQRMRRIGVLLGQAADDPESMARNAAFLQGLQEMGWSVGRNVQIDYRWGAGDAGRIRKFATELVALKKSSWPPETRSYWRCSRRPTLCALPKCSYGPIG